VAGRVEDVWPLTPLQEGLLFHSRYDEQMPDVYVVQMVMGLEGPLDVAVLKAAWQTVLARHATLRACFRQPAGLDHPVQIVTAKIGLPWRQVDLSGLSPEAITVNAERLALQERERRFDMTAPPLLRLLLLRIGPNLHRLVMTNHHIVMDGWSLPLLQKEVSALYAAGGDAGMLPPVRPYRDYVAWLAAQDKEVARAAWRAELAGISEPTLLAPLANGPAAPAGHEQSEVVVDDTLAGALAKVARGRGLTLNTVVQGAWGLLLGRLTGRDDVVFGTTVAGRPPELPGVESMIGLFITTVPVRVRLDPARPVLDMLADLQARQAALISHQHLGLAEIQRVTGLGALFDTLMAYENYPVDPGDAHRVGNVTMSALHSRNSSHYPLTLAVVPGPELTFRLTYQPDAVDPGTAEGIAGRLAGVLEQVTGDGPGSRTGCWVRSRCQVRRPRAPRCRRRSRRAWPGLRKRSRWSATAPSCRTPSSTRAPTGWRGCWSATVWGPSRSWRC
jgi:hypothetical protein